MVAGASGGELGVCGGRRFAARRAIRSITLGTILIGILVSSHDATAALAARTPFAPESASGAVTPTRTMLIDPPRAIREFALTDQDGKPVRLSELSGAPVLVFFGFAHCPSICPAALTQLRRLELNYGRDLGGTRIVVISVDGERDTPAMLSAWLKPISPTFIGLTGPTNAVHDIAAQFSAAFFKGVKQPWGDYLVEHNSQVFLLDAQGRLRATFFDAPVDTMAQVTRAVASESKPHDARAAH
jgi:protein SCO1/2